jgi:hypothetical protein
MRIMTAAFLLTVSLAAAFLILTSLAVEDYIGEDEGERRYEEEEFEPLQEPEKKEEPPPEPPPEEPPTPPGDLIGKSASSFAHTIARSVRKAISFEPPHRRWEYCVAYENIDYLDISGHSWLLITGFERTFSPWGCGVLVPIQRWSLDDLDDFWQIGVSPYVFFTVKETGRIGLFVAADRSFSDIEELEDETSWGAGAFASASFPLGDRITLTPIGIYEYYWTGQEDFDNSNLFTLGPKVDFAVTDNFSIGVFGFYTIDTENEETDDSYWEYGMTLTLFIKDTWGLTIGYQGVEGAEDLDYDRYFLGGHLNF